MVCEGRITEPDYIRGFERWVRSATVVVEIPREHGAPRTLVRVAKERKREAEREARRQGDPALAYDQVWCVFDVDEHPNLGDALQMARDNGIHLAVSNPCFELWLLLHFRDSPGTRDRHDLQHLLRAYLVGYDKHLDFGDAAPGVCVADERTRRLDEHAERLDEPGSNPTTGMWRLTRYIRGGGDPGP